MDKSKENLGKKRRAKLRRRNILIVSVAVLLVGGMVLSATLGFADFLANGRGDPQTPAPGNGYLEMLEQEAASMEQALEEEPENKETRAELGDIYFQLALYYWQEEGSEAEGFQYAEKGQEYLLQAVDEGFEEPQATLSLALLSFYLEEDQRAKEYFERTLELDPENPEALLYYGLLLAYQGALEEAREQWKTVLEIVDEGTEWAQVAQNLLDSYEVEE